MLWEVGMGCVLSIYVGLGLGWNGQGGCEYVLIPSVPYGLHRQWGEGMGMCRYHEN